ncbi:unnamed protein product, partial [Urochloa humidicola]
AKKEARRRQTLAAAFASPLTPSSPRSGRSVGAMALRALVGKLRVLPPRAAASRAFSSQMENKCSKCALEEQAGSFSQRLEEATRRDMEELARYRRKSFVGNVLLVAGSVGFVAFSYSCVADVLAGADVLEDDREGEEHGSMSKV